LLRGKIKLAKGDDKGSAFEGTLQAVLTYGLDAPEVKSVRAVVEGDYLYRLRETQRMPLVAAIESRPEGESRPVVMKCGLVISWPPLGTCSRASWGSSRCRTRPSARTQRAEPWPALACPGPDDSRPPAALAAS